MLVVLHANWLKVALSRGESARRFVLLPDRGAATMRAAVERRSQSRRSPTGRHSYAVESSELRELLTTLCGVSNDLIDDAADIDLRLPRDLLGPWPSDRLSNAVVGIDGMQDAWLGSFSIPAVRLSADDPIAGCCRSNNVAAPRASSLVIPSHGSRRWPDSCSNSWPINDSFRRCIDVMTVICPGYVCPGCWTRNRPIPVLLPSDHATGRACGTGRCARNHGPCSNP